MCDVFDMTKLFSLSIDLIASESEFGKFFSSALSYKQRSTRRGWDNWFNLLVGKLLSFLIQQHWMLNRHNILHRLFARFEPQGFHRGKRESVRRNCPETLALVNPPSSRRQMAEGFQTLRTQTLPGRWFLSSRLVVSSKTLARLHNMKLMRVN